MNQYLVTVEIQNRYWAVQVFIEADSPAAAQRDAQARFDQAVAEGYVKGEFVAGLGEPVEQYVSR